MTELTGKTIAELAEDTSLSGSELFPVMDGTTSKKVSYELLRDQFFRTNGGNSITSGTNIDEMLTPGTWVCFTPANVTGGTPPPTQVAYKLTVTRASTNRIWQIAQVMHSSCVEYRRNYDTNGWGDWVRLDIDATNTDIATIKSGVLGNVCAFENINVASAGNAEIDVAGKRAFVFCAGAASSLHGLYSVYCYGATSTAVVATIKEASSLTLTAGSGNGKITIANGGSYGCYCLVVTY